MVRLETINPDNWRLGLKVRDDQSKFGATSYEITSKISNDMRLHPHNIPRYERYSRCKTP